MNRPAGATESKPDRRPRRSPREAFTRDGFVVIENVWTEAEIETAKELVTDLIERYRLGEAKVCAEGVSIADVSRQHPQRNPGITGHELTREPYIIGNLLALNPRFAPLLSVASLWECASELLACAPEEVVFHMSNVIRKPVRIGPAVGWHRDADNTYCATVDRRTVRLILPLHPMSRANGGTALQVGSHVNTATFTDQASGAVCCPSVYPGSCLAIHADTLHGGAPNRSEIDRDVIVAQFGLSQSILAYRGNDDLCLADRHMLATFHAVNQASISSISRDTPDLC